MNDLLVKAQDAFNRANYQKVIQLLRPHVNARTVRLNHLLARALYQERQYSLALRYVNEMINTYSKNEHDFEFLIMVLLKNNDMIQSRILVNTVNDNKFKAKLTDKVNERDLWVTTHLSSTNMEIKRQLYHLSSDQMTMQRRIVKQAYQLPLKDFVEGVKYLLKDPFINPILSSELINDLLDLQINQMIDVYGIDDQIHKIDLSNLLSLEQTNSYKKVMKEINQKFGSSDQFKAQYLFNTFKMYLLYLYPLNDQIIQNPMQWIMIALQTLLNQPTDGDKETNDVLAWQRKLNQITEKFTFR